MLLLMLISLRSGMELVNSGSQVIAIQMRINFCRQDGFMSEHFLNSPQIGSTIN